MRPVVYLLVLLAALTLFVGLGHPAITDSDEAFYAEAGREMLAGGDWLTPHYNYTNRFQKPILFYWVVAGSYALAGVSEAASRFGSALAGLGIALLAFSCGRRWFDETTGALAGAIVATSLGCAAAARQSLPDLPLAFFITLTVYAAFTAMFDRQRRARRQWILAALAGALGFLTKGPLAIVLPALVVLPPLVLERGWRRLRVKDLVIAAAVFLAVALPWYLAMTQVHGVAYLRGFFIGDNLERFATTAFNPHRPLYFYVPIVLGGMLPWSPFFALEIQPLWRFVRRRQWPPRPYARLLAWAIVPFLLFTVSVGKQPRYILPMIAPLSLLLAIGIRRSAVEPSTMPGAQPRLFRSMAILAGLVVAVVAVLVWHARVLLFSTPSLPVTAASVAVFAAGAAVVGISATRAWRRAPAVLVLAGTLLILFLRYVAFAVPDLEPVEQMAGRVLAHRHAAERVGSYHVFVRNLVFYTHVEQPNLWVDENVVEFLNNPDRVLCVIAEPDLNRLEAAGSISVRRLEAITFFDAPTAKVGTFLSPNPARDLRTAVLVTNK